MQITSWVSKRVLITGSGGFIGQHLFRYFEKMHANVLGIARHSKTSTHVAYVDLTDKNGLLSVVKAFRPDAFFHLASEALVESGQTDPYYTFHNNIESALNVLEVCRYAQVSRIIMASTVHVYGDSPFPYKEDEPARPSRPYETSKTCADLIAQSYADTYGLSVLIPRFVNIYGPGDMNISRIVPKTITTLLNGENPTLWGGSAKRDYLYIDDALRAYDLLGKITDKQIERNRIFNFATGNSITAKRMIETIIQLMGKNEKIRKTSDKRQHELDNQDVSWIKAQKILNWTPQVSLENGLSKTIDWYIKSARK